MWAGRDQYTILALHSSDGLQMHTTQTACTPQLGPGFAAIVAYKDSSGFSVLCLDCDKLISGDSNRTYYSIDKTIDNEIDLLASAAAPSHPFVFERQKHVLRMQRIECQCIHLGVVECFPGSPVVQRLK